MNDIPFELLSCCLSQYGRQGIFHPEFYYPSHGIVYSWIIRSDVNVDLTSHPERSVLPRLMIIMTYIIIIPADNIVLQDIDILYFYQSIRYEFVLMFHNSFTKFFCNPYPCFLQELCWQFTSCKDINKIILKGDIPSILPSVQCNGFIINGNKICIKHDFKLPGSQQPYSEPYCSMVLSG